MNFSLDGYYLLYFFLLIYLASFAIPTGALILIVSFASAAESFSDVGILIILSLTATISGDYSAYWLLRSYRRQLNAVIQKTDWIKNKFIIVKKLFENYANYTVFLSRFLFSGIGPYVNYFSGLQAMPRLNFIMAVIAGELVYCLFYIFIGYYFRDSWQIIIDLVKNYAMALVFILIGIYILSHIRNLWLKSRLY